MGKLADIKSPIDWDENPKHTLDFDPNADTVTLKGQNGEYEAIPVSEAGKTVYLALSNKSLVRALQAITAKKRITVERKGTGFDTTYTVQDAK